LAHYPFTGNPKTMQHNFSVTDSGYILWGRRQSQQCSSNVFLLISFSGLHPVPSIITINKNKNDSG
jgi:hypothetical protein